MKKKKLEFFVWKNQIIWVLLSVLMLMVITLVAHHFNLSSRLRVKQCHQINEAVSSGASAGESIMITIDRADYLGFDYYVDSERQGRYYYCSSDGMFAILLLNSSEDVLLNYTIKGRVISDKASRDAVINSLSSDMAVSKEQLGLMVYPYILSEIDFPRVFFNLLMLVWCLVLLLTVLTAITCIYYTVCPYKLKSIRSTLGSLATRETIKDIDRQLVSNLYFAQDRIMITDGYFIYCGLFSTDIVALDSIESFRKLKTSPNIGSKDKKLYKLIMVDTDGVTYEQNFKTEKALDEALSYMNH